MNAPTIAELLSDPTVQQALEHAWLDSLPGDPAMRHEEGGWVYCDITTGRISTFRAVAGSRSAIDLNRPPVLPGAVVVATFHTHPNPALQGWTTGPSPGDVQSAALLGVPCLIRAEDGIHTTGPNARRGGLAGGPGFPP